MSEKTNIAEKVEMTEDEQQSFMGYLKLVSQEMDKFVIYDENDTESKETLRCALHHLYDISLSACYCELFVADPMEVIAFASTDDVNERDSKSITEATIRCIVCHVRDMYTRSRNTKSFQKPDITAVVSFVSRNLNCLCVEFAGSGFDKDDCAKCYAEALLVKWVSLDIETVDIKTFPTDADIDGAFRNRPVSSTENIRFYPFLVNDHGPIKAFS